MPLKAMSVRSTNTRSSRPKCIAMRLRHCDDILLRAEYIFTTI
jgi:hypothetical protein